MSLLLAAFRLTLLRVGIGRAIEPANDTVWLAGPKYVDRIALPPIDTWGQAGPSSAAWVAIHLSSMAMAVGMIAALAGDDLWRTAVLVCWSSSTSGLVLRLAWRIARDRELTLMSRARVPNAVAGAYVAATVATFEVVRPIGSAAVVTFMGLIVLTIGCRIAALDAWSGTPRDPLFYVRALGSRRVVLSLGLLFATAGALLALSSSSIDRIGSNESLARLLGRAPSRGEQFSMLALGVALMALPTLVVCEGISMIARFHRRLDQLLADEARRDQRARIARRVHDRALGKVDLVYRLVGDDDQLRAAVVDLEAELRLTERTLRESQSPRQVGECLARGLELANRAAISVTFSPDRTSMRHAVDADRATIVESAMLRFISNSAKARASEARLAVELDRYRLRVRYDDNAGGFDPAAAIRADGGLADLQLQLAPLGGDLRFATHQGNTQIVLDLPV